MEQLELKKGASTASDPSVAADELFEQIYDPEAALTIVYCASTYDLDALGSALHARFGDSPMIGATTAGEITPLGYIDGSLTGVSIKGAGLRSASVRIDELGAFQLTDGDGAARKALEELGVDPAEDGSSMFGFLLVDGLAMQEEMLVSSLYRNLGETQLFGGSAGDGTSFGSTWIYHEGRFRTDSAVFTLIHSDYPFRVFKTEHFVPAGEKMLVTDGIPAKRIVTEINGEPAAQEYARAIGIGVDELTPTVFSTHPVVVRVGGKNYVRSIQKADEDGSLTFFCAIDVGIVLTLAEGVDIVENLREAFAALRSEIGRPGLVLGCDCILRNLELKEHGLIDEVSEVMIENNVIGFSTYGEQFNGMHVNQTFTGVAIGMGSAA